jgi:hypothetical protein
MEGPYFSCAYFFFLNLTRKIGGYHELLICVFFPENKKARLFVASLAL